MCVTVLGVEMQAATVPVGLPTCSAMNSGVCAELLQPLGFTKFLESTARFGKWRHAFALLSCCSC